MSENGKHPLHRWSERKAKARRAAAPSGAAKAVDEAAAPEAPAESEKPVPAEAVEQLPDIDSLDADSDYSVFMVEGVPENLKRLALRKLWRSDPVLANVDGLVDYDEDFKVAERMGDAVKTAYRIGKGLIDEAEELAETEDHGEGEDEDGSAGGSAQPTPDRDDESADKG